MGWQAQRVTGRTMSGSPRAWDWPTRPPGMLFPATRDDEAWAKMDALEAIGWDGRVDSDGNPEDGTFALPTTVPDDSVLWARAVRDGGYIDGEGW